MAAKPKNSRKMLAVLSFIAFLTSTAPAVTAALAFIGDDMQKTMAAHAIDDFLAAIVVKLVRMGTRRHRSDSEVHSQIESVSGAIVDAL